MTKVKIVQIALSDRRAEYLDDKGRVWYQATRSIKGSGVAGVLEYKTEWEQLDLPEEPEVKS